MKTKLCSTIVCIIVVKLLFYDIENKYSDKLFATFWQLFYTNSKTLFIS